MPVLFPLFLVAGEPPPPADGVLVVPYADLAPAVGADPADPAWAFPPQLVGLMPMEGSPAGHGDQGTTVALCWRPEALHLRFTCVDAAVHAPHAGRDAPLFRADAVEVFLDPTGDGRQVAEYQVSPNGDLYDCMIIALDAPVVRPDGTMDPARNPGMWWFTRWDAVGVRQAARRTARGWVADLAVPPEDDLLKRTGRTAWGAMRMRSHLVRVDAAPGMEDAAAVRLSWMPVLAGNPHRSPQRMGWLQLTPAP